LTPDHIEADVWLVGLSQERDWLPSTPAESERAARLISPEGQRRQLRSHAALREILAKYASGTLEFAVREHGKPYLPAYPEVRFNLSHSHEMALVAVCLKTEIGVDVEKLRPMAQCLAIAERFFPPSQAAELAGAPAGEQDAEFFRQWTRIEARLKASGIGLYGAGREQEDSWTVLAVDAGPGYVAAVAAECLGIDVRLYQL
jgi:4'-phosphopantetheinyl transferase